MGYSCKDCKHLDKSRKVESKEDEQCPYQWRYGCDARTSQFTCGWISKDSELNQQGCSDYKDKPTIEQGKLFEKIETY